MSDTDVPTVSSDPVTATATVIAGSHRTSRIDGGVDPSAASGGASGTVTVRASSAWDCIHVLRSTGSATRYRPGVRAESRQAEPRYRCPEPASSGRHCIVHQSRLWAVAPPVPELEGKVDVV